MKLHAGTNGEVYLGVLVGSDRSVGVVVNMQGNGSAGHFKAILNVGEKDSTVLDYQN